MLSVIFGGSIGTSSFQSPFVGMVLARSVEPNDVWSKDATVLAYGLPQLKAAILQLCTTDKRVRDYLLSLSTNTAYLPIISISATMIIAILGNHGLIPPIYGIPVMGNENGVAGVA